MLPTRCPTGPWIRNARALPLRPDAFESHARAQFSKRSAQYFRDVGYPPEDGLWIVAWDAAKIQSKLQWNEGTNGFVGHVDFDSELSFNSYADWIDFRKNKLAAGYIMPFVICPSDAALPSAVRIAAMIPTDLTYSGGDLHGYLRAIAENMRAEGFHNIIVNGADHAAVHGAEMVRRALPEEHYESERDCYCLL